MVRNRNHVTGLRSAWDGTRLPFSGLQTTHEDRPLLVSYDLARARRSVTPQDLALRAPDMWRYDELLPTGPNPISLGEVMTPILKCPRLGKHFGLTHLYVKDESRLPTGSFKARGMAVAVTMAAGLGVQHLALPSAGNAGGAAAAYAARAGLPCTVFLPADTPLVNVRECVHFGARVYLVDGLIHDCARVVRAGADRLGWFDLSTMREPYRVEGKKTMGLELAEQFGWTLPDVILYPTGGGTGLVGMWKAFGELRELGWLRGRTLPRFIAVQAAGCAPLAAAFAAGGRHGLPPTHPHTIASGLRVPHAIGDFMVLDTVRASGGVVLTAEDEELLAWARRASRDEGISVCPETGACLAALDRLVKEERIHPDEKVVVFNTGAAQKYVEALDVEPPRIDPDNVPWGELA